MIQTIPKQFFCIVLLLIQTCFFKEIIADTSAKDYDYSHRKRDCEITLVNSDGQPVSEVLIGIAQIRNDFVFGGTISSEAFDTLGDSYGEKFPDYFDVGTPENEMKWDYVMKCSEKCDPDFSKADFLVDWLFKNNIAVRGHNLFCNEREDLIPEWTRNLENAAFKQAMLERISSAMEHYKGKVLQWDLISDICHAMDGSFSTSGMLENKSGDQDIFNWILDEARKIDTVTDFVISNQNLINSNDMTIVNQYINKVKPISSKFEIIGTEVHFGESMDKDSYESKINYLAEQLEKPVLLTDADFSLDINQAPDKVEELMRTCFANPNVGGLIMGNWYKRSMTRSNLTSYFVDSMNSETPAGQRWREVRAEWKTEASGYTDESGKFSFNGFQGKYLIIVSCFLDSFYLEPGEGPATIEVGYFPNFIVEYKSASIKTTEIMINGTAIPVKLPLRYNGQLFLTTYSLSGKQLSRSPVSIKNRKYQITPSSSYCCIVRIETADRLPLYTGKIMATN